MSLHHRKVSGPRWARFRVAVLERDRYRCRNCGRPDRLEVHHVKPLQHGGAPLALDNAEARCRDCHIADHRKPVSPERAEWNRIVQELVRQCGC